MVQLRPFGPGDIEAAHALTTAFRWPHRREDWAFMAGLAQGVAAVDGEVLLGTALAWPYGTDSAALGLVGVAPAMQGRGLGRRLMQAVLDGLPGRSVVLYATAAGVPLYESLGFVVDGTVQQQQGAASQAGLVPLEPGDRLRPIGRSDPPALLALDAAATGQRRDALMHALLEAGTGVVLDRGGAPAGFALLRRFGHGHVIGPVVAPGMQAAQALIGHFLGQHAGQFVRLDVPEASGLVPWLERLGLTGAGPAIRMVRGPRPTPDAGAATYALASQALG